MNLKGKSIFGAKDAPRRPSIQYTSPEDFGGKTAPTLSTTGRKDSDENALRTTVRNQRLSRYVGDTVIVKVNLPDNLKTSVEVPKEMNAADLLRYVIQKRCMKFDEYVIKAVPQTAMGAPVDVSAGEELNPAILVGELSSREVTVSTKAMHNSSKIISLSLGSISCH